MAEGSPHDKVSFLVSVLSAWFGVYPNMIVAFAVCRLQHGNGPSD